MKTIIEAEYPKRMELSRGCLHGFFPRDGRTIHPEEEVRFSIVAEKGGVETRVDEVADEAWLHILNLDSAVIGSYNLSELVVGAETTSGPDGLARQTFKATSFEYVEDSALIWRVFASGGPSEIGTWRSLVPAQRKVWLHVARKVWARRHATSVRSARIEVDCRLLDDEKSFYCSIGEAVHGPGGYFGTNPESFSDMFCDADAPRSLGFRVPHDSNGSILLPRYFDGIMEVLEDMQIPYEFKTSS